MTNKEFQDWMSKLENKIDILQKEVHDLSVRITKVESLYKFVGWVLVSGGASVIIASIVYIFKTLTN